MSEHEQQPEDLEQEEPSVLPAREAMSIITPPESMTPYIPDLEPVSESTPDGTGSAQGAATDAQGSASGEESTTSEDRSEQISNQDTATSET